eukprot:jgi/Hompol1/1684/HPOL_001416-RA
MKSARPDPAKPIARLRSATPVSSSGATPSSSGTPAASPTSGRLSVGSSVAESTVGSTTKRPLKRGHMCHVAVRIRPPVDGEGNQKSIWDIDEAASQIKLSEDFAIETGRRRIDEFYFDSVFYGSDNHYLYNTAVKRAVQSAMEGINATVFAYGQTASGKTYSMMGYEEQPGVIPQAVDDVFSFIIDQPGDREYLLRVSYMEIYNESIRDLLNPEQTDLRIHEHRTRGVYVAPLKEEIVTTPKQLMKIISRGEANRSVGATDFNDYSSRSHTIFTLTIESRIRAGSSGSSGSSSVGSPSPSPTPGDRPSKKDDKGVIISQLNLIDLAGSEKATEDLERRKEGAFINKSLLTLGNVISKITEDASGHIPYRDSKLTRILQSSLSGQSRIAVIATLSPTSKNLEESLNTLKFAARVKRIVPKPEYTLILDDKALIQKYRREIEELKTRLSETNMELEKERQAATTITDSERQRYEEQLHEARLARTALKERIDHLTKLILTSSSVTSKPLLDWTNATSSMDAKNRASVMLSPGLLPPADPVARASMIFDPRTGRSSRVPMSMTPARAGGLAGPAGRLTDRAFIEKHIQEIDRRDQRIASMEKFISSIKKLTMEPAIRNLISEFEEANNIIFEGDFSKLDLSAAAGFGSAPSGAQGDLESITQHNQELEIVVQEHQHQIAMLKKRLEECQDVIAFNEADHAETAKVVEEQQEFIETLKERNYILERRIKTLREGLPPSDQPDSLEAVLDVVRSETTGMDKDELVLSGWPARIAEITEMLQTERDAGTADPAVVAELEAELFSLQARLRE